MKTTLTIDDDILDELKAEATKETDKSFEDVVNETLRLGLLARDRAKRPPFKIKSKKMGRFPGLNYDNIEALLDQIEGPDRKW